MAPLSSPVMWRVHWHGLVLKEKTQAIWAWISETVPPLKTKTSLLYWLAASFQQCKRQGKLWTRIHLTFFCLTHIFSHIYLRQSMWLVENRGGRLYCWLMLETVRLTSPSAPKDNKNNRLCRSSLLQNTNVSCLVVLSSVITPFYHCLCEQCGNIVEAMATFYFGGHVNRAATLSMHFNGTSWGGVTTLFVLIRLCINIIVVIYITMYLIRFFFTFMCIPAHIGHAC